MTIGLRACCSAAALALLVPAIAAAQPPRNPFSDLFGRVPDESGREYTALQFRSNTGAQMGWTLQSDFEQPDAIPEGLAAGGDADLVGEYIRDRVQAVAHGRYSYQEYRRSPAFGAAGFDTGGSVTYELTTRLSVEGSGQYARSPYFQMLWLTPDFYAPPVLAADSSAILLMRNDSAEAMVGVTHQLTKRSTISASGFARETRYLDSTGYDFSSRGARGMWNRSITRSLGIHAGYSREELRQTNGGVGEQFTNEIIDVGIDFAKGFSFGQRTTLAFATETSMVRDTAGAKQIRLNGNVAFQRRFLRTWSVHLSARRATEFMPGFTAPLFTERGAVSLAGYLAKRLVFDIYGDGARGEVGIGDARQFVTYTGNSRLTFALSRHIGIFTQYVYTHYQMPPDALALVTVPRMSRQAVSIGLKTWVPIIDKKRMPSDSR